MDASVRALRERVYMLASAPAQHLLIRVDASNAFNDIEMRSILEAVVPHLPRAAQWVYTLYGLPGIPKIGKRDHRSQTGTQQGYPLGMLLFSLALQPVLLRRQQRFPVSPLNV
eukprot:GFKZ01008957.1.p1 GENE.GFKZ01008957.1~~GFKZ01008957.1.p1  ORF type:complete len:128 (-),score=8.46 GFKZ01008957.1:221-559(-)